MSFLTAVKAKLATALTLLGNDPLKVGFGDEGAGPVYNTVTIDSVDLLQGQAWSGPALDPDAPADGPDPALVNLAAMAQLVAAFGLTMRLSKGIVSGTQATGAAATLTYNSVDVDTDLVTQSVGQWTALHAGFYDVSFNLWGNGSTDDTIVRAWIEVNGVEVTGTRSSMIASLTLTESACAVSTMLSLTAGQVVRIRHQKTLGTTFNLQRASFVIGLRG